MVRKIGVIGVGRVGLPLALVMAKHFKVKGVDASQDTVSQIKSRGCFTEKNANEYLEQYSDNFDVSTDFGSLRNCDTIFVVVGTQDEGYSPDNVKSALKRLAPQLVNDNHILVIVSTVNPNDMDSEIVPLLHLSGLHSKIRGVCYNPAMIALGNVIRGFEHPDYVLIGESNKEAGDRVMSIWREIVPGYIPIVRSNITNVETAKFVLNLALVNKISFINTVTEFCEKVGADIDRIAEILKLDPRIAGKKMFRGGLGFGGPCFPRDVYAFKKVSEKVGVPSYLCDAIQQVNKEQISRSIQLIESFEKKRISILGITYKPNTSITVESQALEISRGLQEKGYDVIVYDPAGAENAMEQLKTIKLAEDMRSCIHEGDIVFIAVPWAEFSQLEPKDFSAAQIIIDPWRLLRDKKLPCKYVAYGLRGG